MIKYIIQRLIAVVIVLFVTISLSFFVLRLMPGSFVDDITIPQDIRVAISSKYHLDKPLTVQYGYFIKDFIKLDFGTSYKLREGVPVFDIIKQKLPETIRINLYSNVLILPFGFLFGTIAAIKKNTRADVAISTGVVICISVPSFVFASLLQYFLAFKLGWFPILESTETTMSWNKFVSLVLPTLALSFGGIAGITRNLRAELTEALNSDFMLLAKSKGLSNTQATVRHAIRNAMLPIIGGVIGLFLGILGGSLVIERIFGIPGIGAIMIDSINAKDHSVTIGMMFMYSLISLVATLIVDLSYGIVDPRIRMGGVR